jgi:8-oxo-dGTP diphosphatase
VTAAPPPAPAPTVVEVDVVLLTLAPGQGDGPPVPQVRLVAPAGRWQGDAEGLPGMALPPDLDLDATAVAVLAQVGVPEPRHLEQLASFGAPGRVPGTRAVSVAYLALVPAPHRDATARGRWVDLADVGPLALDHADVLAAGVARVRSKLSYSTVAYGLLPDRFTMTELQAVYEALLGVALDKRNFRRKVAALGLLADTGAQRRGPHRPARLYTFATPSLVLLDDVIAAP